MQEVSFKIITLLRYYKKKNRKTKKYEQINQSYSQTDWKNLNQIHTKIRTLHSLQSYLSTTTRFR